MPQARLGGSLGGELGSYDTPRVTECAGYKVQTIQRGFNGIVTLSHAGPDRGWSWNKLSRMMKMAEVWSPLFYLCLAFPPLLRWVANSRASVAWKFRA